MKTKKIKSNATWMVALILISTIFLSTMLITYGEDKAKELGFEIAKLVAQLTLIGITGGIAVQNYISQQRQHEAMRELRAKCQQSLVRAYVGVKKARRELRAGLSRNAAFSAPVIDAYVPREDYIEQMGVINDLQLELEVLILEGNALPDLFKAWSEIRKEISKMRDFLSSMITEYEEVSRKEGHIDHLYLKNLPKLADMLHGPKDEKYRERFTEPFHKALHNIQIERIDG
ncbi:hypothetical protein J0667_21130 [Methylomonas sp. WH-1]|uniref:hypothetical protein n=1 Tax=unclassified Methylomonas TaxID=2608980 RepID=UPI00051C5549|nr:MULTISPECIES: hypothetical protein [unclassified Methylomonas]PKD38778.1 hypothetical protein CWO84_17105 [Methylomonas sp. Kb3]